MGSARAELTTVGTLIGHGISEEQRSRCALVMKVQGADEEWEEVIVPDMAIVAHGQENTPSIHHRQCHC